MKLVIGCHTEGLKMLCRDEVSREKGICRQVLLLKLRQPRFI